MHHYFGLVALANTPRVQNFAPESHERRIINNSDNISWSVNGLVCVFRQMFFLKSVRTLTAGRARHHFNVIKAEPLLRDACAMIKQSKECVDHSVKTNSFNIHEAEEP